MRNYGVNTKREEGRRGGEKEEGREERRMTIHKVSSVLHTREHTCPWTHMYKGTRVDMHVNNRVHAAFAKSGATTWRYKIKSQKILMCSNTLKFKICLFKKKVHFTKFSNNVE